MKKIIKTFLDLLPPSMSDPLLAFVRTRKSQKMAESWKRNGRQGSPPHIIKQEMIAGFGKKFHCKTLVESGTFLGDMVYAQKRNFEKIYSVELSPELWQKAARRFKSAKNIEIIYGDSGKVMSDIAPFLKEKTLFWLDGHYSGGITAKGKKECPVYEELESILQNNRLNHLILIDDARLFDGTNDYPELNELLGFIEKRLNNYVTFVENDIICIIPGE